MNFSDTPNRGLEVDVAGEIDALISAVQGRVLLPGDGGFEQERAGFQTAHQHQPAVIVAAADAGDVCAAVAFAAAHELAVAVQATGHGLPVAATDGMLISTRQMTEVEVDAQARTAQLPAGARWQHVIDQTVAHGLAPLSGSAPDVGAVSYTLGGGLGLLARRYGYAADHVRRIVIVGADARLRHVTADSDPDLFWALRGGRSNFGVVCGLEIDLVPVARLYGGGLYFASELAGDVLHAYQQWSTTIPDELTSSIALIPFPNLPAIPEPLRGRHVAHVRIAYTGDAATGQQLIAPLRAIGPRLIDTVTEMPYAQSATIHNDPAEPMAYAAENIMLGDLDTEAVQSVLDLARPGTPDPADRRAAPPRRSARPSHRRRQRRRAPTRALPAQRRLPAQARRGLRASRRPAAAGRAGALEHRRTLPELHLRRERHRRPSPPRL